MVPSGRVKGCSLVFAGWKGAAHSPRKYTAFVMTRRIMGVIPPDGMRSRIRFSVCSATQRLMRVRAASGAPLKSTGVTPPP